MSMFLSLRSRKARRTTPVGEPSQMSTEPERISDNSSSFGGIIYQFPSPPSVSPTGTIKMTLGALSRQQSTRHSSNGEARGTDDDGLPFIPPSEIGGKFPTPTPGLSSTSLLIPRCKRNTSSVISNDVPWSGRRHLALSDLCLRENLPDSRNDRDFSQAVVPGSNTMIKSSASKTGENQRQYQRRSRSATGLEELGLARNPYPNAFANVQPIQVSNTIGDIVESYSSRQEGEAGRSIQADAKQDTEIEWSPRNSDQSMGDGHLLFYGKSPSFTREQAVLQRPPSQHEQIVTPATQASPNSSCGPGQQRGFPVVRRKPRISSLPLQSPTHGRFIFERRRHSISMESNAGDSNVALPSSTSETSDGKRQSKVLHTHPRYGDAYSSLTADHQTFSSSSTKLSTFQWTGGNERVVRPLHITHHGHNGMGQRLQSGGSDCNTSQGFSDYADLYEDVPPGSGALQGIHRRSSASGPGHRRQATPPLLFGTRAIGESDRLPSPPSPTRSNSRLVRAAEAAGLQQSGRLMRAITDSSERDWETVAGTIQGDHVGTVELESSSSHANNSTSQSDPISRGFPTEPQPLPQPAHPRYVQTWTLQKEVDQSTEVLVPSSLGSRLLHGGASSPTQGDGQTYQHPAPLSKHTNPFSSSPIFTDPANPTHTNIRSPILAGTGLLGAATTQDDHSMSNYSLGYEDLDQGSSAWVSTVSPEPALPRIRGGTNQEKRNTPATGGPFTSDKAKLVRSASAEAIAPKINFSKSSSRDTGSSLADLSSSPMPATSSPADANLSSSPEIPWRTHKRRTFDGSLTSIAVEAEERNPMRKYMTTRENSYQSVDEPDLDALPAASRADIQAHKGLLAKEPMTPELPFRTPPHKRPNSSMPIQRLASASSSAKEIIDAAAARGGALILPVMTPRSSFHGSAQNRARANGVTNSTAIELQPLSPPQAFRIQTRLKRRGTLLRLIRRKSSNSNPRSPPLWEDTTRHPTGFSRPVEAQIEPATPSKAGRRTARNSTPHLGQPPKSHDGVKDRHVHLSRPPQLADLSLLPSGSGNLCTTEPTVIGSNRNEQDTTLVPHMEDDFLISLRSQRRSVAHSKSHISRPVRPTARKNSPHLHQFRHEYEDDLALQKRFSRLLIVTCLPLFPTLLMLGQPGSDKVVRMLSNGQASRFYRPYTIWTRSLAASLFSAGVAAIIVVACMDGFR